MHGPLPPPTCAHRRAHSRRSIKFHKPRSPWTHYLRVQSWLASTHMRAGRRATHRIVDHPNPKRLDALTKASLRSLRHQRRRCAHQPGSVSHLVPPLPSSRVLLIASGIHSCLRFTLQSLWTPLTTTTLGLAIASHLLMAGMIDLCTYGTVKITERLDTLLPAVRKYESLQALLCESTR